jgi:hypothetical protein
METKGMITAQEFKYDARPSGTITQWAGVQLSAENTVILPADNTAVHCFGVAATSSTNMVGSDLTIYTRGKVPYIAGDTQAVGDELTLRGTVGRFFVRKAGEPLAGYACRTATAAAMGLIELAPGVGENEYIIDNGGTQITADTTVATRVPAGTYLLDWCYLEETAGNAVTGNVNVGTSAGGTQIASAVTVGASLPYKYVTASLAAVNVTFASANPSLYVSSSNWNSASVRFFLKLVPLY